MRRFVDDQSLGCYVADKLAEILKNKPDATFCIAAGTTSFPVFDALKARVKSGELSFAKAKFFAMDEWCGLPQDADGAMADFLRRHFLNDMDFKEEFLFDGMADPQAECERAEAFLDRCGGLDGVVFGIGVNGHVALNEPGVDPNLRTHVTCVDPVTANVAQKYFANEAPRLTQGVTIGIANVKDAKAIFLTANTSVKQAAVVAIDALAAADAPSSDFPASFVAVMPQTELLVTDAVFT